jgi:basic membrane protein A and related proteins
MCADPSPGRAVWHWGSIRAVRKLALIVPLALLLAACGGSSNKAGETTGAATTTTASGKAIKVGLVTDINQLNDHGFNQLAYEGLQRAEKKLGVNGAVLQSPSAQDYIPNLSSLAQKGYDLVIGVGFDQAAAVDKVAAKFPKTNFAIIDVDQQSLPHKPANVLGLLFREQEAGYLVGYLAGLETKKLGGSTVSTVGGEKQPPVDRYIAGFQAGAKAADPGVKLLNGYSQDWVDTAKCKELALNQIAAGSKVVFQVAGGCGLGVLDAAKQKGVWGIGVDADQSFLGPQVLTSALKRVDSAVYDTIKQVQDGSFKGGTNAVFGLDRDGVGVGKVSPKVPKSALRSLHAIEQKIIDHKLGTIPTTVR